MTDKLTLTTLAVTLTLLAACTEQVPAKDAPAAGGALINAVPKAADGSVIPAPTATPITTTKVIDPSVKPTQPYVDSNAKPIAPIEPVQPTPPPFVGGTRFGLRQQPGRRVIRLT